MPHEASLMPVWAQVLRLVMTFVLCVVFGIQAYARYKSHLLAARRWMFFLYSIVFLFTSVAVFTYLIVAVRMRDYSRGPFQLGLFSVLLILSYLALTYGTGKSSYYWSKNGQHQRF